MDDTVWVKRWLSRESCPGCKEVGRFSLSDKVLYMSPLIYSATCLGCEKEHQVLGPGMPVIEDNVKTQPGPKWGECGSALLGEVVMVLVADGHPARTVSVTHGDDLIGLNVVNLLGGVPHGDGCEWCRQLTARVQSRVGRARS